MIALTHLGYIVAAWTIVLVTLALYSFSLMRRGRALAVRVPADRRRWMTAPNQQGPTDD